MTQLAKVEVNKFVGGLITDASPLTYPDNASFVDINMELNSDGSRQRSLGMDYEAGFVEVNTGIGSSSSSSIAYRTYRWENVGGDPLKSVICVQFGNQVKFFDSDNNVLSTSLIGTRTFSGSPINEKYSFTSVDGSLVIASGVSQITIATYDSGVITYKTDTIKVRDFWGVEDKNGGDDLTTGQNVQKRPTSLSQAHLYNLRNQGFAIPHYIDSDESAVKDPVNIWTSPTKFPSNSDTVVAFLYANADDSGDRTVRRFFAKDLLVDPIGNFRAAQGYFIIDLFNRGAGRISADAENRAIYPELVRKVTNLPSDKTSGGVKVISEFAGRVWFGGFSGDVIGGDEKSPNLSSYVTFSQLITDKSLITKCYQDGDPTSDKTPDIIDTDGGYIRISNSYGIKSMIALGNSLFVGGASGWWRIYGGNDSGFSATNYVVDKISDRGVLGPDSVVEVDNTIVYWSDDGIYHIKTNEFGEWVSNNITQTRIQKLYNDISTESKYSVVGVYDGYQKKVRWLYDNSLSSISVQKELVLDLNLSAFYERHISQISGNSPPVVLSGFNTNSFKVNTEEENITVGGVNVTVDASIVTITREYRTNIDSLFEVGYLVVTDISPTIKYTFAAYTDVDFVDWKSYNTVGVDAPATLITGALTGGDAMRFKQVPYLIVHMKRTETGFELDGSDIIPSNQSSCMVQSQWDWTNSANSNKWSTPFQVYRYNRFYMPSGVGDLFDTGYETIVTKNKLRGRGRAFSLKFTSSPKKEMHLYGWSMAVGINNGT